MNSNTLFGAARRNLKLPKVLEPHFQEQECRFANRVRVFSLQFARCAPLLSAPGRRHHPKEFTAWALCPAGQDRKQLAKPGRQLLRVGASIAGSAFVRITHGITTGGSRCEVGVVEPRSFPQDGLFGPPEHWQPRYSP